jgi:hypothetical protein
MERVIPSLCIVNRSVFDTDSTEINLSTNELSGNTGTELFTLTFTSRMIKHKQGAMAKDHQPVRLKPGEWLQCIVSRFAIQASSRDWGKADRQPDYLQIVSS